MPESLTQASIDAHSAIGRLVARRPRSILAASLAACAWFIAPIAHHRVRVRARRRRPRRLPAAIGAALGEGVDPSHDADDAVDADLSDHLALRRRVFASCRSAHPLSVTRRLRAKRDVEMLRLRQPRPTTGLAAFLGGPTAPLRAVAADGALRHIGPRPLATAAEGPAAERRAPTPYAYLQAVRPSSSSITTITTPAAGRDRQPHRALRDATSARSSRGPTRSKPTRPRAKHVGAGSPGPGGAFNDFLSAHGVLARRRCKMGEPTARDLRALKTEVRRAEGGAAAHLIPWPTMGDIGTLIPVMVASRGSASGSTARTAGAAVLVGALPRLVASRPCGAATC